MQFPGKGSPDKQTDFNGSLANCPKIKKKKHLPQKTPHQEIKQIIKRK